MQEKDKKQLGWVSVNSAVMEALTVLHVAATCWAVHSLMLLLLASFDFEWAIQDGCR